MRIEIKTNNDSYECETCGTDYASGGSVYIDGFEIVNLPAIAHCYSGQSFSESDLLVIALRCMGHEVILDGDDWYITCAVDDA